MHADYIPHQVLEEYLDEYRGVLLIVSHDRYFCDRVLAPPALEEDEVR